jgi:hypothetical protein
VWLPWVSLRSVAGWCVWRLCDERGRHVVVSSESGRSVSAYREGVVGWLTIEVSEGAFAVWLRRCTHQDAPIRTPLLEGWWP